jgi:hypothetical protein
MAFLTYTEWAAFFADAAVQSVIAIRNAGQGKGSIAPLGAPYEYEKLTIKI